MDKRIVGSIISIAVIITGYEIGKHIGYALFEKEPPAVTTAGPTDRDKETTAEITETPPPTLPTLEFELKEPCEPGHTCYMSPVVSNSVTSTTTSTLWYQRGPLAPQPKTWGCKHYEFTKYAIGYFTLAEDGKCVCYRMGVEPKTEDIYPKNVVIFKEECVEE